MSTNLPPGYIYTTEESLNLYQRLFGRVCREIGFPTYEGYSLEEVIEHLHGQMVELNAYRQMYSEEVREEPRPAPPLTPLPIPD